MPRAPARCESRVMTLEPGTVLDTSALGFTLEVIATGETTGGVAAGRL